MKFAVITHAENKIQGNNYVAYEPYVREMNLWFKYVGSVKIVAPISTNKITSIDIKFIHSKIEIKQIPQISITSFKEIIKASLAIPTILWKIYKVMRWAEHIHVRCPGNIGLLGCFVQLLFPYKPKTFKYAGNWDYKSKQPWSYRLQKRILSNSFLTRNAKVLVYGEWPNQSKNIIPFFTATYSEKERHSEQGEAISSNEQITSSQTCLERSRKAPRNGVINFIFVGALTKGKQPLVSIKVLQKLKEKGYKVTLDMYGDGGERNKIEDYIIANNLNEVVTMHGNTSKEIVKKAYQQAHFLVFISKSEGWPKVVAEAMFWGCLPITSNVSCIPYMLGNGSRGAIVNAEIDEIVLVVEDYIQNKKNTMSK